MLSLGAGGGGGQVEKERLYPARPLVFQMTDPHTCGLKSFCSSKLIFL